MALQDVYDDPIHATDIDLSCHTSWDSIYSFDWETQVPNTTVDVIRGIEVGLAKTKDGVRKLLIRFVDTSVEHVQPKGGAWYNWKDTQPSVWAIAFAAPEIRRLSALVAGSESLIHREPWTEPSSWWAEANWVLDPETARINGIRIAVQASQDIVPKIHEIRFLTKGHYFRFVSSTDSSPDAWEETTASYLKAVEANKLPESQEPDPNSCIVFSPVAPRAEYTPEGDSPIECDIECQTSTTHMFQSSFEADMVIQVVTSGRITLRNPTDADMYIKHVSTEYRTTDGSFKMCEDTKDVTASSIGTYRGNYMVWGIPHPDVSWRSDSTSLELPSMSLHEVCIKAAISIPKATAFQSKPFDMRLHSILGDSVTIRATFTDDGGKTKKICWDCSNPPLEPREIQCYDDVLKDATTCEREGLGMDFECLVFLYWDNPETFLRSYLVVTKAKESTDWFIRAVDTTGAFPRGDYTKVSAKSFQRLVYDSPGLESIDMSAEWSKTKHCKLRLLVDPQQKVVYGLTAIIESNGQVHGSRSIYLNQSGC